MIAKTTQQRDSQPRRSAVSHAVKTQLQSRRNQYLAAAVVSGALAMPQQAPAQDLIIEEIVVTAQKKSENMQDVPISITALDTTRLSELGISDFDDYVEMLPNVSYKGVGPGTATIYMRGAADGGDNNPSGASPSVALYLDEQPVTAIGTNLDVHIYDVARIEVLGGPQGTLYGASAQAGTMRIITNKPDPSEFSAGFNVGADSVSEGDTGYSVEGYVNIPIGESAAIRIVAWNIEEGGYIDNVPGTRTYVLEGQFGFDPITVPARTLTIDNASLVEEDFNELTKTGARAALRVDLNDNWTATAGVIYQNLETDGTWDHDPFNTSLAQPNNNTELQIQRFFPDHSEDEFTQASITIEGEFGNVGLVYAGSFLDRDVDYMADYTEYGQYASWVPYYACDYTADLISDNTDCTSLEEFYREDNQYERSTHELRLQSLGDGRLHYTAGVYYNKSEHTYLLEWVQPGMSQSYWVRERQDVYFTTDQKRELTETAIFGELTFDFSDSFSATVGGRFFSNESTVKGFVGWGHTLFFPDPPGLPNTGKDTEVDSKVDDDDQIFKLNLTWRIGDDVLLYATASEGYRPGGVNRDPSIPTPTWVPDKLTNYEFGWKTTLANGRMRLNGAAYFMDWDDIQYTVFDFGLSPCCGNVYNLSTAEIKGVEADIKFLASEALTLSAGVAFNSAETTADFVLPGGTLSVPSGTDLPAVPDFKGNVVGRYEFNMGNLESFAQLAYIYTGSRWSEIRPSRRTLQDSYSLVNARFGIGKDNWSVEIFGNNLADERADIYISPRPYEPSTTTNRPRTVGVKLSMRF